MMRSRNRTGELNTFSCEVCTYNRATGKGGERLKIHKAMLFEKRHLAKGEPSEIDRRKRNPHHEFNQTRNIMLLPSREIRTIHIRLIERFNNKIVYD